MRKRGQRRSKEGSESETFVPEVQAPQQDTTQEPILKKIVTKVFLGEEKEEEILEWILEWIKLNPTLYDKSLKEFKNKSDKDAKWKQKAEELGISGI